jgi:hypothetical protein
MEHRWGNRVPADVEVQIFASPASAGWGRLRDISISGGFLETRLRVAALSTLSMTIHGTGVGAVRSVRAIAVRRDTAGVGVEWFDGDSEIVAALIQEATVRQAQPRLAPHRHSASR